MKAMRWVAAAAWAAAAVYAFWAFGPALWLPVTFLAAAVLIAIGGQIGRVAGWVSALFAAVVGVQLLRWALTCSYLCPSWVALVGSAVLVVVSFVAAEASPKRSPE